MATTHDNWVAEVGHPAYQAIREMVAAMQVDWDRLEELREQRDGWGGPQTWEISHEDESQELEDLEAAAGECENEDDARQRIEEDPLSIELGGWWAPGSEPEPTEYRILLTTGGPAVRIVGELGEGNEPANATLQVQDWFKPWTEYHSGDSDHDDILMAYVACFYFGD